MVLLVHHSRHASYFDFKCASCRTRSTSIWRVKNQRHQDNQVLRVTTHDLLERQRPARQAIFTTSWTGERGLWSLTAPHWRDRISQHIIIRAATFGFATTNVFSMSTAISKFLKTFGQRKLRHVQTSSQVNVYISVTLVRFFHFVSQKVKLTARKMDSKFVRKTKKKENQTLFRLAV